MKIGLRTPSIKKRVRARTTGKIKRKAKGTVNPLYGMKGMGYAKNPKRVIKNKIYKQTTFDVFSVLKKLFKSPGATPADVYVGSSQVRFMLYVFHREDWCVSGSTECCI